MLDALSANRRIELGELQPWGNPSYLAATMGSADQAVPWRENMAPSVFSCPACSGMVTATSHPTIVGHMALICSGGCNAAALRAACEMRAPRAFAYSDDLLVPISNETVAMLTARATDGTYSPGMKGAMRELDRLRRGATSVAAYPIGVTADGPVIVQFRADYPAGHPHAPKSFLPVHGARTVDGAIEVRVGLPGGLRPIVGQDQIIAKPGALVMVAEGEKAWTATVDLLPETAAITSLNGAHNAHHTDWSPLADTDVVIVPDNDPPGREYARSVAAQAHLAGARRVRIMRWAEGIPVGYDLGDPLPDGVTLDDVRRWIAEAPDATWEQVKDALRVSRDAQQWPPFRQADGHLARRRHLLEAADKALERISSGCHKQPWLRVLGAVYHAFGSEGLAMAITWSQRGADEHGKFRPGEVELIFEAFALNPQPRPMSINDLFWQAWRESAAVADDGDGWRPEPAARADGEIAAFGAEVRKLVQDDNVYIAVQKQDAHGRYRVERKSERTAESIFKSRRVRDHDGKKLVSVFKLWEVHGDTKPLDIVFRPGQETSPDEYNSFQGFDVAPVQGRGTYKLFRDLMDRVMAENKDTDGWLWNCAAFRVQHPDKAMESIPCLVGPVGSGKSTFSSVMAKVTAPYSYTLSEPDRFVGRNNACLDGKLFVRCEEMVLAHREDWMERVRNYTTNATIDVEEKYRAQSQVDNRMWVVFTANRTPLQVLPGERRYAMYRVSDPFDGDQAKRTAHYEALHAELDAGGIEALMYDLLHHPIPASFDRRNVPKTDYYLTLIGEVADRDPLRGWWREMLEQGALGGTEREDQPWTAPISKDALYENYAAWCQNDGSRSRSAILSKAEWAKGLGRMLPGGLPAKRMMRDGARIHVIVPPLYEACCAHFEQIHGVILDRAPQPAQLRSVM